jgi:signal transduction histidine kinase
MIEACPRGDGIEIAVSDTGIGIAPDALPTIFEPFRRADGHVTKQYDGVGLGLYIVRRFLQALGGSISVESKVGCGSTFRVWLPVSGNVE